MDKKEEFKLFVSKHPELVEFIKNKEMTWQDFYEIYDIYGDSQETWNKYFERKESVNTKVSELSGILKNINFDNIENHLNNAQKIVGIIQELTKKTPDVVSAVTTPVDTFFGE